MKKSRFSDQQIIDILKEFDQGVSAQDLCRKHGIGDSTFYRWREKYAGLDVAAKRRLDHLEAELAKAKQVIAQLTMDNDTLREAQGRKF